MATYRVLSVLFCRTYRLYFIIFFAFLILQLILAISFYKIRIDDGNVLFKSLNSRSTNNKITLDKDSLLRNFPIGPGIEKDAYDYIVDDEDRQDNKWERLFKDSSSRNISPKDSDKQKSVDIVVPEETDLNHRVEFADKNSINSVNGSKKYDRVDGALNLDELDFFPWCNITTKEAVTAIHRATTQACKHEIANISCLMQQDMLYPKRLPRYCPLKETVKPEPKPASQVIETDKVGVVFLLTVNGRAVRQVYRLINSLFNEKHYFYIHVDSRQDYLYRELKLLEKHFPNIRLSQVRLSTIWGGASLLQMLMECMQELLQIKDWNWDYIINLSESDFPIKSLSSLERFLISNNGRNFVKSHGQDTQRFIAKQGLDKTFYECDMHMWRLGDRILPWGIRVDGGSDWIALHRNFCSYLTQQNNTLLQGLLTVFRYTLLPAESFFHTVLQNSEFCETVIDNNLHVTNWKRKQGCKCQYKHIVDWCGCSPNVFKPEDWPRLQATEDRPYYFARKFEPIINQQIIEQVETWIYGPRKGTTNLDSYWQSDYHFLDRSPPADDSRVSTYESFARLGMKQLQSANKACKVKVVSIIEATLYSVNDVFKGLLILYKAQPSDGIKPVILETQVRPIQHYIVYKGIGPTGRLKFLQVGSDYDLKEQIFRNYGRILGPFSELGLIHKWGPGVQFAATFVWLDPTNTVAGSYEVKIESGNQVLFHKPTFRQPLRPGTWSLKLLFEWELVAETLFLVTPLSVYNGHAVSSEQVKFLHNGPGQPYVDHDFTNVEVLLGYANRSTQVRQALSNSRRFGKDLREWTDSLVSNFWSVQETCYVNQPQHASAGQVCPDLELDPCHATMWSSHAEDPKSSIGDVRMSGGIT